MSAVASKPRSGRRKTSAVAVNQGQPPFTEESYKEYLSERPKIRNEVAREDPDESIFDAMMSIDGELKEETYGGKSIRDIFKRLK
jgi:hypothetical protein